MRIGSLVSRLWANWLTLLGSLIAASSALGLILLLVVGLATPRGNPYLAIFVIIVLPVAFGIGLLLIGAGIQVERRKGREAPQDQLQAAFEAAFNNPSARRRILFVVVGTVAIVALSALAGHAVFAEMESPKFCGTTCHAAMQPQWDTYSRSTHSNVPCVDCHVGENAAAMLRAKWNGIHQLVGVITSKYSRPVVARPEDLLPARETCQNCHTPRRFKLDRIKVYAHYALDQANTPKFNAVLLRLGGLNPITQKYEGIHWHADPDNQVNYEFLDRDRTKVGRITLLTKGQKVAEYAPAAGAPKALGVRTMDCVDCHNRPAHMFDFTPKNAVDKALLYRVLDPKLPFIAEVSVGLLGQAKTSREGAEAYFRSALADKYQSAHPEVKPDTAALDKAAKALALIYRRNIYPDVKEGWNLHYSNTGHTGEGLTNPGCFRCHDGEHATTLADGRKKKISQECDSCHAGLAFDEDPAKFDDTLASMVPAAN